MVRAGGVQGATGNVQRLGAECRVQGDASDGAAWPGGRVGAVRQPRTRGASAPQRAQGRAALSEREST
jgi:hypothetical protein